MAKFSEKITSTKIFCFVLTSTESLVANPDLICLECRWDDILKLLDISSTLENLGMYKRLNKLKQITFFSNFSESKLVNIIKKMYNKNYKADETIFEEGSKADAFYMIVKGKVKIYKHKKLIRELDEGCTFGEIGLIKNEARSATIIASTDVKCFVLTKENFSSLLDRKIIENLNNRIPLYNSKIDLSQLYYVCLLGKGKFGIVNLVHNEENFYAIKSVSKKIVAVNPVVSRYIETERRILISLDHPFIIKLVKTLKDNEFVYFVTEFIDGCTLEKATSMIKKKKISDIQFYIGSLLLIVEFIHKRNIVHRDLKPENLMVDNFVLS